MAQQVGFVEDSIDRVQSAVRSVEDEFERLQKQFGKRRKQLEREAQKRVKQIRTEIRKQPLVKRAESLRGDARKQIETGVETILATLQIASRGEVQRLDRKLGQINRKLSQLEKGKRHNGASA